MMMNRRKFLHIGFLGSLIFLTHGSDLFSVTTPKQTLALLQEDLFGYTKELNVDTHKYMNIVLHHSKISNSDKEFIKNGIKWLNEESYTMFQSTYTKLSSLQRQEVLKTISHTSWGERFIYDNLAYIMEAVFSDPIYGVSYNKGSQWLDFQSGLPRPTKAFL